MNDLLGIEVPAAAISIYAESKALNFSRVSRPHTGALLRTLVASKAKARVLELGTGTGASAAWLLDGMDAAATLVSVENDGGRMSVARRHLGHDKRITLVEEDARQFLRNVQGQQFDFIFADTWAGKYEDLELALTLLADHAFYCVDDMLPQDSWPPAHAAKLPVLISQLTQDRRLRLSKLSWGSGILIAVRVDARRN